MLVTLHRHALTRVLSSAALLALAVGVIFANPGFARDRAARQVRSGSSRSTGNGLRLSATRAESYAPGVEADPLSQKRIVLRAAGKGPERPQASPPAAMALPATAALTAPHPGATVPGSLPCTSLAGSLVTSPSRGPPTL
jgi:hypothetical protein